MKEREKRQSTHKFLQRPGAKPIDLLSRLDGTARCLRQIQSAAVVCAQALKCQNCERDRDVASLLLCGVVDGLEDQIEILVDLTERKSVRDSRDKVKR